MPLRLDLVEEGSRVSYADAANPRREGRVAEIVKVGGETPFGPRLPSGIEYRVSWDDEDGGETVSDLRQHGWNLLADLPGNPFDGADIIAAYTRDDAIADGTLVPVSDLTPDEPGFSAQAGFTAPVALTTAAAALVIPTDREAHAGQDVKGRLWDVLNMARFYKATARRDPDGGATWLFPCIFYLAGAERSSYRKIAGPKTLHLKCVLGPGDDGSPVVTIMLRGED